MLREERETQLKGILKNEGLEAILVIYSQRQDADMAGTG